MQGGLPEIAAEQMIGVGPWPSVRGARRRGRGLERGRLEGTALFALDAVGADRLLVHCAGGLALVSADAAGVEVTRPTASTAPAGSRSCACTASSRTRCSICGYWTPRALAAGRIALAFDLLGLALPRAAQALALAYASERKQFGRVIGSFQAVKHMLCRDPRGARARALARPGTPRTVFDHEAGRRAAHRRAPRRRTCPEVATEILRKATEVHGGIGFTDSSTTCTSGSSASRVARQLLGGPGAIARARRGFAGAGVSRPDRRD